MFTGTAVGEEFHLEVADVCVVAEDPGECMKSYGFKCHRLERPGVSLKAHGLGCNLELPNGQSHFVQMLNNGSEWTVEVQKTSTPEPFRMQDPTENTDQAISNYVFGEMANHNITSNGSVPLARNTVALNFASGASKNGAHVEVRTVCAVEFDGLLDDGLSADTKDGCEKLILRAIQIRSQFSDLSPFSAGGAGDVSWKSTTISLASGVTALVLDGRYTFSPTHRPCRWQSDCCSRDGAIYLDSCRTPSTEELQVIEKCLARKTRLRSDEYFDCLRDADVRTGCDDQADGSRICY